MHAAKRSPSCRLCEPPGPAARQWRQARPRRSPNVRCAHRSIYHRFRNCQFSCDPENWSYVRSTSKTSLKRFISSYIRLYARAAVAPLRVWFLARAVHDSCDTEDPDTLVDNSSFVGVTWQQWDPSVLNFLRCRFLCTSPPSSLDPRFASEAFTAAKADSRDKFNGDDRPLAKIIRRGHFPCCPRLRRMMSKESEIAQVTLRHGRDSFYLYEVSLSRFARQVVDLRRPVNRLGRSDDESLNVGDNTIEGSNPEVTFLRRGLGHWWLTYATVGDGLDESGSPPFAIQTDRDWVCIIAEASASANRGMCSSPRPLGAVSAPQATVGCGHIGKTCARA